MPVILQYRIYRSDLELNPYVHYCFGDNEKRVGMGGQAKECRGEHNAIGICTKKTPGVEEDAYYTDEELERNMQQLALDFAPVLELLEAGETVVIPTEGFGTGLAELKERAPRTLKFIETLVETLVREFA